MFTIKTRVGESKYAVVRAFDRLMKKCKYPTSNIKWLKDLNNEAHEIYERINQSYRVRFPKMNEDGSWPENDHTFPESYLSCHRLSTTELRHRNYKDNDTVYVTFDGQVVLENNTHYAYRVKADGRICIYTSESGWLDITEDYENGKEKKMYTLYVRKFKDKKLELEWECKNKVMRTWSEFFYSIYRFFHTLDSIYLCSRFPFLYLRNRWTGRHYNNWKLSDYCKKIREKNRAFLNIVVPEDQSSIPQFAIPTLPSPVSLPEDMRDEKFKSYDWCVRLNGSAENQYYLSSTDGKAAYRPVWHLGSLKVYHATFGWITLPYFEAKDTSDGDIFKKDCIFYHEDNHEYAWHYTYVHNHWKERWCKIVDWFNYSFLGFIFGIPTRSEIDAMDEGWMHAFGMDLLKELKAQLKKDKYLYKYRITQIKEKYGCYDEKTEVLTKDGFKYFKDITSDDEFATLNESTDELEYQKATDYISYEYDGLMYVLKNRGVDIKVTPNHNLYVSKGSYYNGSKNNEKREYPMELTIPETYFGKDKRFKKGCLWTGTEPSKYFKIPDYSYTNKATSKRGLRYDRTYTMPGPNIELIPFLKFLGFYVAEGCINRGNSIKRNYSISVAYNPYNEEELVTELITNIGFVPHKGGRGLKHIFSAPLANWLRDNCSHLAPNKKTPEFIKNLPPKYIEIYLTYLFIGDGHQAETSNILSTTSAKLRDDVCELLLKCGYTFSVRIRNRQDIHGTGQYKICAKHTEYCINWLKETYVEIDNSKAKHTKSFVEKWSNYKGNVYCVTVPNHILYIRRNGKGYWCGNSLRWYDAGATKEVHELLSKYENLSEHTCIYCGRPAKYITTGYVLPYCENCISEESKIGAYILDENGKVVYDPYEEEREEDVGESNADSKA